MAALITYSISVVYNLFLNMSLKSVFNIGLRWFMMTFLIVMLSQFVIYAFNDIRRDNYRTAGDDKAGDEADDNLKSELNQDEDKFKNQGNEAGFQTESAFSSFLQNDKSVFHLPLFPAFLPLQLIYQIRFFLPLQSA